MKNDKKDVPKVKIYYTVLIETMLPATLSFKVLAETPEEALLLIKNQHPASVKHKLHQRRDKKATVSEMGSSIIKFIKNII